MSDQPKYPQPKIFLVDLGSEAEHVLSNAGYNVSRGSFGVHYKVPRNDDYSPVIPNGSLPNFAEQEVVAVDLVPVGPLGGPLGEKLTSLGEPDWWASNSRGIIDPRPRLMARSQDNADRILSHGGTFVVFADSRERQNLVRGFMAGHLVSTDNIHCDNWSFLSILSRLDVEHDPGREISVKYDRGTALGHLLVEHAEEAYFSCTMSPGVSLKDRWLPLATNKYGLDVAGIIFPAGPNEGLVFIFPQLRDKAGFLVEFFNNVLPDFAPHLFPHAEGANWVYEPEYEIPQVLKLQQEIQRIKEETRQKIATLEQSIHEERTSASYQYDLLRGTGRPLVLAVKEALETLGFESVIDVDEELAQTGDKVPKREDLRIEEQNAPVLLVEVKGISGLPREASALQVWKYLTPRMKEWNRTDVQGLAIVNHQRNLPALERENRNTFSKDVLTNAEEQGFGLLTTWDIFRLLRGYLKNDWKHEHVRPLFYQSGRIEPVPNHYELVGVVEHFWEKPGAVGVRVEAAEINQGDSIAYELSGEFKEQVVDSLQVENEPVTKAEVGALAGIKTPLTKKQARKGVRVFRLAVSS